MPPEEPAATSEAPRRRLPVPRTIQELKARKDQVLPQAVNQWRRTAGFLAPIVLFFIPILLLTLLRPDLAPRTWGFYPLAAVLGVDVSVIAGIALGFTWWYVALWVMWGQILLCAFLLWNLRFLRRWPRADRYFTRKEEKAIQAYHRRAWLRKFHFWGLCVFTVFPVGTGIYVGVLLGKLTGLTDLKTGTALMIGTAIWLIIFAYGLEQAWDFLRYELDLWDWVQGLFRRAD